MKLVLYSGYDADNDDLDVDMLRLSGVKHPSIAFIPALPIGAQDEFEYFVDTFHYMGVKKFIFFPLNGKLKKNQTVGDIFKCDIIYLSGGNTFYLLHEIYRHNLMDDLRTYAKSQGVLAGMSAGSIVMTPTIRTASFPKFDRDENHVKIRSMRALNITKFEFFPHFNDEPRYAKALKDATKSSLLPMLGVSDGAGILIHWKKTILYGNIWLFYKGLKFKLHGT